MSSSKLTTRPNGVNVGRPKPVNTTSGADEEARAQQDRTRILNSPTFRQAQGAKTERQVAAAIAALTPNSAKIAKRQQARKLLFRRFLKPSPVVFLDWDDTILPTSWLAAPEQRVRHISSVRMDLLPVANACQALLEELNRNECHVSIVTNADRGWVEETCNIFFPSLLHLICPDTHGNGTTGQPGAVPPPHVVSARHCFEELHPRQPTAWKAGTFAWEMHRLLDERRNYQSEVQRKSQKLLRQRSPSVESNASASSSASTASAMSESKQEDEKEEEEKDSKADVKMGVAEVGEQLDTTLHFKSPIGEDGPPDSSPKLESSASASSTMSEELEANLFSDADALRCDETIPIASQIVSVGDSDHEHEACHLVARQFNTRAKTMHLAKRGPPDVIRRQLEMITSSLPSFLAVATDVDVDVDI